MLSSVITEIPPLQISVESFTTMQQSVRSYGFGCVEEALDTDLLTQLFGEANEAHKTARHSEQKKNHRTDKADLSDTALRLLRSDSVCRLLNAIFGTDYHLLESHSCLTFYSGGSYLGLHRDQPAEDCAVTVIIYLDVQSSTPKASETGLVLHVYSDAGMALVLSIPTTRGSVVVGRGAEVWHERPMLQNGESVCAITACYRQCSQSGLSHD